MKKLTVLTPTCGRPIGLALLARWLTRQTRQPDYWVIGNGGPLIMPPSVPFPVEILTRHQPLPPGTQNFCDNLERAIAAVPAATTHVAICEDDDWLAPTHLATLLGQLTAGGAGRAGRATIAGDPIQRYYHLPSSRWRLMNNHGASLCQTGFVIDLLPVLAATVRAARAANHYAVDAAFWTHIPHAQWGLDKTGTVVGIKGLPGQAGLGLGHRPTGPHWTTDPAREQLVQWVGADAAAYIELAGVPTAVAADAASVPSSPIDLHAG